MATSLYLIVSLIFLPKYLMQISYDYHTIKIPFDENIGIQEFANSSYLIVSDQMISFLSFKLL